MKHALTISACYLFLIGVLVSVTVVPLVLAQNNLDALITAIFGRNQPNAVFAAQNDTGFLFSVFANFFLLGVAILAAFTCYKIIFRIGQKSYAQHLINSHVIFLIAKALKKSLNFDSYAKLERKIALGISLSLIILFALPVYTSLNTYTKLTQDGVYSSDFLSFSESKWAEWNEVSVEYELYADFWTSSHGMLNRANIKLVKADGEFIRAGTIKTSLFSVLFDSTNQEDQKLIEMICISQKLNGFEIITYREKKVDPSEYDQYSVSEHCN